MESSIKTPYGNFDLQLITKNNIIKKAILTKLPKKRDLLNKIKGTPITSALTYIEKIDSKLSLHHSCMFSNLIEQANNIDVDKNLEAIRNLFLNLEKIEVNLEYFYKNVRIYDMRWHIGQIARYNESILKAKETITGRRFFPNLFRPNGLNLNLTFGKIKRIKNINFILDKINLYLNTLVKDLSSFNHKNLLIFKAKIFATQNYIQDYISLTNTKLSPITPNSFLYSKDFKKLSNSIYTPRGASYIELSIENNLISYIKLNTPSETNLKIMLNNLKNTDIDELIENINIHDISLLELSK